MRRIVGKSTPQFPNGKRFGDDMIATTGNAAASIALRNAVTRGIPKALWKELFDEAKKVAGGSAQTFGTRRDKTIKELGIQGATPDQIFALLGVTGIDDLRTEHLVHLRGLYNAIKDGEITVDEAFGAPIKPGQVIPPQPSRSDFERGTDPKTGEAKSKPAPQAQAKSETAKVEPDTGRREDAKTAATVQEQGEPSQSEPESQVNDAVERAAAQEAEFETWYAECKAELENQTKVRDMADLRDRVADQLDGARLKEWDALCTAKQRDILNATRRPKGGK
jgi:hypothetical protein